MPQRLCVKWTFGSSVLELEVQLIVDGAWLSNKYQGDAKSIGVVIQARCGDC